MNTSGAISPSNIGTSSNNPTNTYTHGNIQKIGERLSSDISSNGNDISLLNCFTHEGDDKITIDSRQGSILIEKGEIAADVKSTSGKIVVKEAVLKKINTEKGAVDISKRSNVEAIETLGSGDVTVSESVVNENISTTGGIVKLLQGSTAKQINTTLAGGSVIVDQSQVVEDISTYGGSVQIQNKSKVNNITTLISRGEITVDESTVSGLIKTADASVTLTCKANVSNINTKGDLASVTVRESSAKEINTIGGYIEIQTPTYLSESLTTERGLIFINSAESSNNINIDQKTGISFIYKTTLSGTLETNSKCTVINQDSKLEHIHFKIPAESNTNAQFPSGTKSCSKDTDDLVTYVIPYRKNHRIAIKTLKNLDTTERTFDIVLKGKVSKITVDDSANPGATVRLIIDKEIKLEEGYSFDSKIEITVQDLSTSDQEIE